MITLQYSSQYLTERKKFLKNNKNLLNQTVKCLKQFSTNPQHPSLNLEKLSGSKIWTIRIDRSNRIFLHYIDENTALLIDIGKHDKYRKY